MRHPDGVTPSWHGWAVITVALAIGAVGLFGVFYSVRSAVSSLLYCQARYARHTGSDDSNSRAVRLAQRAYRLDRGNHHFWSWLSDRLVTAYAGSKDPGLLAGASVWSQRGLAANGYGWRLNVTRARVLAETSPDEAVRLWERYVAWHYWEPFNHAYLSELYARAGDLGQALQSLKRIEGTRFHGDTSAIVLEWARRQGAKPLPLVTMP